MRQRSKKKDKEKRRNEMKWDENPLVVNSLLRPLKEKCGERKEEHGLCGCVVLGYLLSSRDENEPSTEEEVLCVVWYVLSVCWDVLVCVAAEKGTVGTEQSEMVCVLWCPCWNIIVWVAVLHGWFFSPWSWCEIISIGVKSNRLNRTGKRRRRRRRRKRQRDKWSPDCEHPFCYITLQLCILTTLFQGRTTTTRTRRRTQGENEGRPPTRKRSHGSSKRKRQKEKDTNRKRMQMRS